MPSRGLWRGTGNIGGLGKGRRRGDCSHMLDIPDQISYQLVRSNVSRFHSSHDRSPHKNNLCLTYAYSGRENNYKHIGSQTQKLHLRITVFLHLNTMLQIKLNFWNFISLLTDMITKYSSFLCKFTFALNQKLYWKSVPVFTTCTVPNFRCFLSKFSSLLARFNADVLFTCRQRARKTHTAMLRRRIETLSEN